MNRIELALLTIIIVLCLPIAQISMSFALTTSTHTIAAVGSIKNSVEPTRTRKHVVAYVATFIDETANFIASHFDMVDTEFEAASTIGKIKALNPNIIILGYKDIMAMHTYYDDWAEVNSHEDWFLHDIHGNRLIKADYGWYAMDVGNPGWRSHYANYVKNKIDNFPFDGVFADDVWDVFPAESGWNPWTVPIEDVPVEIKNRWHDDMVGMLKFVKATMGSKLLIVNTSNNGDYVDASDGKMEEEFVHPSWYALDEFHDEYINWRDKVESLKNISQRGKYYLAHSGTRIPDNPTEVELSKVHDIMIYCFASYLLGVNGEKATVGFNDIYSQDGAFGYYPVYDVSLGSPINDYYLLASVYSRDFEKGKVLVNPTTSSYTINLGNEYKTLDDQTVSSVTLDAHSGIILLKP